MYRIIKNDKKYIYVFFHIAKTAGSTLRYHLKKNFKNEELLHLSFDAIGLDSSNPPVDEKVYKKAVFNYISKIPKIKRSKIKVVYGHCVHYGIDKYFTKKLRYFTFVRRPSKRIVSLYNHLRTFDINKIDMKELNFVNRCLMINGKTPEFYDWFINKYLSKRWKKYLSMAGYLQIHGFLSNFEYLHNDFEALYKRFYFIGLVGNYNLESMFIYELLGIKRYFLDENISVKYQKLGKCDDLSSKIIEFTEKDQLLYRKVQRMNNEYKYNIEEFNKIVGRGYVKHVLLLPFTSLIFSPRRTIRNVYINYTRGRI